MAVMANAKDSRNLSVAVRTQEGMYDERLDLAMLLIPALRIRVDGICWFFFQEEIWPRSCLRYLTTGRCRPLSCQGLMIRKLFLSTNLLCSGSVNALIDWLSTAGLSANANT